MTSSQDTPTALSQSDKQVTETSAATALVKRGVGRLMTCHSDIKIIARGKNPMLILDVSSSMGTSVLNDPHMRSRYHHLTQAIKSFPNLPRVSFNDSVYPNQVPPHGGWTDLYKCLRHPFVKDSVNDSFIMVSDGEPSREDEALEAAISLKRPVNVIFIGDHGSHGHKYMRKIAEMTGGIEIAPDANGQLQLADFLQKTIAGFLGTGSGDADNGTQSKGPIIL